MAKKTENQKLREQIKAMEAANDKQVAEFGKAMDRMYQSLTNMEINTRETKSEFKGYRRATADILEIVHHDRRASFTSTEISQDPTRAEQVIGNAISNEIAKRQDGPCGQSA